MANLSGSFTGKTNWQTTAALHDRPNHELNLAEIIGTQKSTDEKWNDANLTYWGTADLIAGSGTQRGYFVNEHTNGDRDWGTFQGRITSAGGQVTLEGTWTFTGGTGTFNGLTGTGSYRGRMISPTEVEMTWEGTYQLAAARAAG